MEEYGFDGLAASADAVMAGLGLLVSGLARLAVAAGRAVTLAEMELLASGQGREILRGVVQLSLDAQAAAEVRLARVTGADGVPRTRAERGHRATVVTTLGAVSVRRIAYRAGVKGVPSLFPRDAVLNLPPCGYSWQLQRLAEMASRSGSYEQARELVLAATGVSIGKRQVEQITARAASDAERCCQDPGRPRGPGAAGPGRGGPGGPAAAGDLGGRQGRGDASRGQARHRHGARQAGPERRAPARHRGKGRPQADGRDRLRLRRPGPRRPGTHSRAGHVSGTRQRQERAARGEPLVHHRHHRRPRRHHRQGLRRGRAP